MASPDSLPTLGQPTEEPAPAIHPYRGSRERAIAASVLIVAAAVASLVGWLAQSVAIIAAINAPEIVPTPLPDDVGEVATKAASDTFDILMPISHLQIGPTTIWVVLAVAALIAWAAWLSRVVDNLPALGAGYARVSPQIAFIENFLMGRNLYSMPARVREVTTKLHATGGGDGILAGAWIALFGSLLVGRVAFYVGTVLFGSGDDYLRWRIVVGGLTSVGAAVGYLLVVAVIWRVENLAEERLAERTAQGS